jgi:antitoxin CptB
MSDDARLPGPEDEHRRRLAWQCRRGMRELDLLLSGFLKHKYAQLSETERRSFETLLKMPDQVLVGYLIGQARPTDPRAADLAERIRRHAGSTGLEDRSRH